MATLRHLTKINVTMRKAEEGNFHKNKIIIIHKRVLQRRFTKNVAMHEGILGIANNWYLIGEQRTLSNISFERLDRPFETILRGHC